MIEATFPLVRSRHERENLERLAELFEAQRADVQARLAAGLATLLSGAWDGRLADLVHERNKDTATEIGNRVARALRGGFDPDLMDAWLLRNAEVTAANINDATRERLDGVDDTSEVDEVFDEAATSGAARNAATMVAVAANFGAQDAAKDGAAAKMWIVNSTNPRSAHAAMGGEIVPVYRNFSNGMAWPGDPVGGADNLANCRCSLAFL